MGIQAAVAAYRDSKFDSLYYNQDMRVDARSLPIIGGLWSALKMFGNVIWRPFKIAGALAFGYEGKMPEHPPMPPIPEEFGNSELGKDFEASWKARSNAIEKRVQAFGKLLGLDITGWMRDSSVASHNEVIDRRKYFPEEGEQMGHGGVGDPTWTDRLAGQAAKGAINAIGNMISGGH